MSLHIAPGRVLPLDAVTETFAILAVKRAGKSNAAVVMAEEMYDEGVPWVAIDPKGDWWGVRAAGDGENPGLSVLVLGGLHGDIPLEPTAGKLVADLIAEQRITCVLDVSEMTKADQRRFLTDFADRLYRRNTEPLHVFCEEADEYIPQRVLGDIAKLVGAFETLVKRGGFRGIGVTLITQRSASLNKDVLTQAGTLIAMRTPSPQDRKAVLAWIDYHAASRDVIDELPMLEDGEAWLFSPQWLKTLTKIRFRRRRTFDSGATPKVGGKPKPPATLADVDLAAIKEQMAETIEKAAADDPKILRKRIADLERQLRDRPTPEPVTRVEYVDVIPEAAMECARVLQEHAHKGARAADDFLAACGGVQTRASARNTARPAPAAPMEPQVTAPAAVDAARNTARSRATASTSEHLPEGEQKVLVAIAQTAGGCTREQVGILTGYKRSTRNTYLQRLSARGLVEVGDRTRATDAGLDALGDSYEPLPTGAALRAHWLAALPDGEARILGHLCDAYPSAVSRERLSDLTEYKTSTRNTYIQRLAARQLVTTSGGDPRASDVLFD